MSAPDELTERLTDLEVRVAYQERTITTLDELIRHLIVRVDSLEHDLRRLEAVPPPGEPPSEPESELSA